MKKLLSVMLATATAAAACIGLAACGGDNGKTITVWAPDAAVPGYQKLCEEFTSTYKDGAYKDYTINFVKKAEGDVAAALGTDAANSADVFFFEQGQIETLVAGNLLQPLTGNYASYATAVQERDMESSVKTATKNNILYAFPTTADNGWFMWYDSTYFTGTNSANASKLESLDDLVALAAENNLNILFDYANTWYNTGFFFGLGCSMDYKLVDGAWTYETDIDGANGLKAAQAMIKYFGGGQKTIIGPAQDLNGDLKVGFGVELDKDGNPTGGKVQSTLLAGFCGTWVAADLPENIKAAKCPKFTIDGQSYQLGSFMGGKYCGVNPRRDNKDVAMALADFLTNEKGQAKRFETTQAGPTNKNVSNSDAVKANGPLAALAAQNAAGGYAQLKQDGIWDPTANFLKSIASGTTTTTNLQEKLTELATTLRALKG